MKKIKYAIDFIFFFSMYILGVLLIVSLGFIKLEIFGSNDNIPLKQVETTNCEGIDLFGTANCLNKELSSWWNYNLSNTDLFWNEGRKDKIDWDVIKEQGGVCWHSAQWYLEQAKNLNFNTTYVSIPNGDVSHAFTIISNEEGYCILDQEVEPKCVKLASGGDV